MRRERRNPTAAGAKPPRRRRVHETGEPDRQRSRAGLWDGLSQAERELAHQELQRFLPTVDTDSLSSIISRPRPRRRVRDGHGRALLTPNQVVAYNVTELREERKWTQQEAARQLDPWLGKLWSKATFSAIERSITGTRVKAFDADELSALALAFEVAVWRLFVPPDHIIPARPVHVDVGGLGIDPGVFSRAMVRASGMRDDHAKMAATGAVLNVIIEHLQEKHFGGNDGNLGTIRKQDFVKDLSEIMEAVGIFPADASIGKAVAVIRRQLRKKRGETRSRSSARVSKR